MEEIRSTDCITPEQCEEIRRLLVSDREYAGSILAPAEEGERLTYYLLFQRAPLSGSESLAGILKTLEFEEEAVVVYAYVHPDYRRRGYFKKLLETAGRALAAQRGADGRGEAAPKRIFVFPVYTESGAACAKHMRMREGGTEYHLALPLPAAQAAEDVAPPLSGGYRMELADGQDRREELAQIHSAAFGYAPEFSARYVRECCEAFDAKSFLIYERGTGVAAGCGLLLEYGENGKNLWLCGFCVLPRHRRRHAAAQTIGQLAVWAAQRGYRTISVQVSGENEAAYGLYRRAGFLEKSALTSYFTDIPYE